MRKLTPPPAAPDYIEAMFEEFSHSFDARVWADAFIERVLKNRAIPLDIATMTGWFANALMRGYDEHATRQKAPEGGLIASEAIYAFAGWLTCRPGTLILGATHNAAPAADLVGEFCQQQGLADPRPGWEHNIVPKTAALPKGRES